MSNYKSIFKNLPFPCLLFEKQKGVFVINEANTFYCKITHVHGEELKGKVIKEVFPENPSSLGLKEIEESLEIAYTSQEPHKIDVLRYDLYDRQSGVFELKYWEIDNIPIFDETEDIRYILNVVKDITVKVLERDRCEKLRMNLEDKTETHEQFVQRITDGLFSLDREGDFVSLNQGLIEIAETSEADLLKMNFLPFCGKDHREEIVKRFNAAINGINQKFEANFVSGKGRSMVLEISLVPLKNDGIITGLYGIAKDITRLKDSEDALLRSERKFKALVQEGSDLIGILDLEGKYKFVSETSSSVLGIPPSQFLGKTAFNFMHPEDRERVIKEFSKLESKDQIEIQPFRFKNAQGVWRWVETIATNLVNDPAIEGIVTNSRDVTERKISENNLLELNQSLKTNTDELIRANKGLEQYSYIISHNLRAPVANILGLTELLNDKDYSEEIRQNLRSEIQSNAQRMDKVIKDLNQILQIKQDFSEVKQLIDLNEIVHSIKISLQDLIKKENINIISDFREVDQIKSLSSYIHSIFYNLIFNSIKFRQPGVDTVIKVTSKKENGIIRFVFKDNGLGMDLTKKKDEVFGLYKRFHHHVEGKGMGLFMVKTQVEMLGGKITLASKVNSGSTFTIEFRNNILKL